MALGEIPSIAPYADALGAADLTLAAIREGWKAPSPNLYLKYWLLWTYPHSGLRTLPGFKELLREAGFVDYWRQSGNWADACKPVGDDDFECR